MSRNRNVAVAIVIYLGGYPTVSFPDNRSMSDSPLPLRFDMQVPADGRVEIRLPLPAGAEVTMYVVERSDSDFDGLLSATSTSTEFWNCPEDDEDWNNA
jgi:hypothetical protein